MIVVSADISVTEKDDLVQFGRYLEAQGVADGDYTIAPDGDPAPEAAVDIRYRPAGPADYALAEIRFPMADGTGRVQGNLSELGTFLCMLLAHEWDQVAARVAETAPAPAAFEQVGLPQSEYWSNSFVAAKPGLFVAPDRGGFVMFFVENNGVMRALARSRSAAALIVRLGASIADERIDLASRMAPYYPD